MLVQYNNVLEYRWRVQYHGSIWKRLIHVWNVYISFQMMAGVNLFSCLLTTVSLVEQGGFFESAAFMLRHPDFVIHSVVLSICSATGQLFIFYTIAQVCQKIIFPIQIATPSFFNFTLLSFTNFLSCKSMAHLLSVCYHM